MNELDIENSIQRGIRQTTPDLLDSLMGELNLKSESAVSISADEASHVELGSESAFAQSDLAVESDPRESHASVPKARRLRIWYRTAISAAAVIALVAIGFFAMRGMNQEAFAVVGLDVNPSIELSVDGREKVIEAVAINGDGDTVLDGLDLKGVDLNTACHAVVGSMLVKGYLTTESNSILVSIRAQDTQAGKDLEQQVSRNLHSYLETSDLKTAIWGQYVENDEELTEYANANGISFGQAFLIRKLLEAGDAKMDEPSLRKLSTQELILLAQNRKVESDTSIGQSDTSAYISEDAAVDKALADANVNKGDAGNIQVEFDCENGVLVYEVEFNAANTRYEYSVNARSGEIVSVELDSIEVADVMRGGGDDDDDDADDDAYDDDDDFDDDNHGRDDSDDDDVLYDRDDDDNYDGGYDRDDDDDRDDNDDRDDDDDD